jgi:branched-subunit amino acid transport protein
LSAIWIAVIATSVGCYAFKLAGLTVPNRILGNPRLQRFTSLIPIALLAALIATQTTASGRSLTLDGARLAGLGAAVIALLLRAPFLVVIVAAAATAATLHALGLTLRSRSHGLAWHLYRIR